MIVFANTCHAFDTFFDLDFTGASRMASYTVADATILECTVAKQLTIGTIMVVNAPFARYTGPIAQTLT